MTRRSISRLAIPVLALSLIGCGNSRSPTAPAPVPVIANVAGTWNGAAKPAGTPEGFKMTIAATLAQNGAAATGTLACDSFFCVAPSGTITATVTGTTFTAQVAFPNGGSCGTFKGTVSDGGSRMDGTYVCAGPDGSRDEGTWQLTK